jgi:HEPN domain-containing protein
MNKSELIIIDWLDSTQEDFDIISLGSQVPLLASTCYHCGQAVEKILKAYLIAKENNLTKTHDLDALLEKCETHSPDFGQFKKNCENITAYATIRYPPRKNLTKQEMEETIEDTHEIVNFTMSKLKELGFDKPQQPASDVIEKMIKAVDALPRPKKPV